MRTIQVNLYKFSELSPEAQARACEKWRYDGHEYSWLSESLQSVQSFCDHFGVNVTGYALATCSYSYISTDATNSHFRGFKLKHARALPEYPTGYCLDETLQSTFINAFDGNGGDALAAFISTIDAAVHDIVADMEYQDSDEAISELLEANEYEFNEQGEMV